MKALIYFAWGRTRGVYVVEEDKVDAAVARIKVLLDEDQDEDELPIEWTVQDKGRGVDHIGDDGTHEIHVRPVWTDDLGPL